MEQNHNFKKLGSNVKIFPSAKIVNPEMIEIDDSSKIDDFTFINGGKGIKIGKHVHVCSFVSIIGGGELILGDYAGVACGARIITGTNISQRGGRMSGAAPENQQDIVRGKVVAEKDSFIGTNCVIHPNVTIGEGAIIGSNSLVTEDVEPWTINMGNPCKVIGRRPKVIHNDS